MFKAFSEELFRRLSDGLEATAAGESKPHLKLQDQLSLIRGAIAELMAGVAGHPFLEEAEEIHFYKVILPPFRAELVYHVERYNLLAGMPAGGAAAVLGYYQSYLSELLDWIDRYWFYYRYRRLEAQELDSFYFTVSGAANCALVPVIAEADGCGTAVGYLFARFMAIERLYGYVGIELDKLRDSLAAARGSASAEGSGKAGFQWTGKAIDLIEVAHGLHLSSSIGNGSTGVVEFFKGFGEFFGVDLGIPKKGLDNLMERKTTSRTRFTDGMRDRMQQRMDELERHDPDRRLRRMRL